VLLVFVLMVNVSMRIIAGRNGPSASRAG